MSLGRFYEEKSYDHGLVETILPLLTLIYFTLWYKCDFTLFFARSFFLPCIGIIIEV